MIGKILQKIIEGQFEYSRHAVDQSLIRHISVKELREVIVNGEIIEYYPEDKYGPSCLIFGFTAAHRPVHVQCSYPTRPRIKIITLYEPDPNRWLDYKRRSDRNDA